MKRFIFSSVLIIFSIPALIWYRQTGDLSVYFSEQVPQGQFIYVLSKLVGMYALLCIAWQVIASLLNRLEIVRFHWMGLTHRLFGTFVVVLSLSHVLLFFSAVTLRQGSPAWGLLLPSFKDFYHTHLSFGLIGLLIMFLVMTAGIVRIKKSSARARTLHSAYWVSIVLVYLHALAVGTESQSKEGLVFYGALGVVMLLLFTIWLLNQGRLRLGFSA